MMLLGGIIAARADAKDLDGVTQNWDKKLPANDPGGPCPAISSRFTCVLDGAGVRDNETGLVWERSPSTSTFDWQLARGRCASLTVGGRMGWRLPSHAELTSIADPTAPPSATLPTLPPGHPFSNVQRAGYWSATTDADNSNNAWATHFDAPDTGVGVKVVAQFRAWCVRGGTTQHEY